MRTVAVLPVKSFSRAKRRLNPGLAPQLRRELAEAMLRDVLRALTAAALDEIIVVTAGEAAGRIAQENGARVLHDSEQGHNAAAALGIDEALRAGAQRALLVPGDCPALDPGELDELLERAGSRLSVLIVPDRHGTGTNALLLAPPDALAPSFGPDSCARHLAHARLAGIDAEAVEVPSLALDIDTPEDLAVLTGQSESGLCTHELLSRC